MKKPSVLVTRRLAAPVMERLARETELVLQPDSAPLPKDRIIAAARECDAMLPTVYDPIDAAVIAAGTKLRVIANFGVGYNNIDVAAATARRLPVTNTPGVLSEATADIAFGLLLAAARRFSEGERMVRTRHWTGWDPQQLLGADLCGATLGIIGFGGIGRAVARRAQGFGLRVIYWNRTRLPAEEERKLNVAWRERDTLLGEADFVSLHVAYAPETHHLIDAAALARMKRSAVLVNTARGAVVDEPALVRALRDGVIAAAGLDVFEREPQLEPELYDLLNCTLLPHLGSATHGTRTRMGMLAVDNLLAGWAGQRPPNCVNPAVFA
jgi:glyoxylate reductase